MKHAVFSAAAALVFVVLMAMIQKIGLASAKSAAAAEAQHGAPAETGTVQAAQDAPEGRDYDGSHQIRVLQGETLREMDLRTYLTGVLLAELPDSFAPEAKKAQAIACRTYALRCGLHSRHDRAAVCTDSTCCQGWTDPESVSPSRRADAEAAVRATDGLVLRYGGELIDATFFSCSGGRTEAAVEVWGSDAPYLQAVDSPGEEQAPHDTDEIRVPLGEFQDRLREENPDVVFPPAQGAWIGAVSRTAGGGVDQIELGGRAFSGRTVRRLFSLRSTAFTLTLTGDEAIFETRGYGHRVGMSQYGAEAMAEAGKTCAEILTWYYRGAQLAPAED